MAKFFHTPKAKKFSITPRYYDERKEQRLQREAEIIKELEAEKNGKNHGPTKEQMADYIKFTRKTKKKSNIRLLLILVLLLAIYYFFYMK